MLNVKNTIGCVLFVFVLLCFSNKINAQNETKPDERLYVKYSQNYISNLLENNPEMINYLNFTLDNSCYFVSDGSDKFVASQQLKLFDNNLKTLIDIPVNSVNKSEFNVLKYDIQLNYTQRTTYRIGNTNEVVVFYSLKEMADRFNKLKQSVK